jgi:hypothetical protein
MKKSAQNWPFNLKAGILNTKLQFHQRAFVGTVLNEDNRLGRNG